MKDLPVQKDHASVEDKGREIMNIILIGLPGSGKGTQAKYICDEYSIQHISTGDILRKSVENQTPVGKKAESFLKKGILVPDNVIVEVIESRITESDCVSGFLLDGFPRTAPQAQEFEKILSQQNKTIDFIFDIFVKEATLIERLTGRSSCKECGKLFHNKFFPPKLSGVCDNCGGTLMQRNDDNQEVITHRIKVNSNENQAVKEFYGKRVIKIDGADEPKQIFERIRTYIKNS